MFFLHPTNHRVASNRSVNLLTVVVFLPVTFVLFSVVQAQLPSSPGFCVFYFVPIVDAHRCVCLELVCCGCWTSHKYLWALKKKKRKNLQLAVNCSHFICSCWYFLFALFCLCFRSAMPPCEYVPDIRSVCSFEHLLLRLCLSQRLFFFFLLLVEWWDAYFGNLHCGYPSKTFFTYL